MFDDNHMDRMMKSILESGQEEVPARVWDGISEGLDRIERRKSVVLWFRRAGVAAAAAAVAVGVILNMGQEDELVPMTADSGMIAVVEPEHIAPEEDTAVPTEDMAVPAGSTSSAAMEAKTMLPERSRLLAYAEPEAPAVPNEVSTDIPDEASPVISDDATSIIPSDISPVVPGEVEGSPDQGTWQEDETELKDRRMKTSLVISGIAGTNNPQSRSGINPMRSPALGRQYTKTTIEQTSTETIYGIPLSFGAGVKLNFNERWSLGMGLNYTLLTSKFNGKYIRVTDGIISAPVSANIRNLQHYIGIPINAYYNIISRDFINFYAYAGGTVEKCIMNTYQVQTSPVIHHTEDTKGVQLSADLGIGVEFMLGRYVGIYVDPSLRYYFRNGQPKSIRTAQPLMLGFEMGFRFNL